MTDALNDILIECCKLRGCYPLMHRTLHEFDWFCSAVIFGAEPGLPIWIEEAEEAGDVDQAKALKKRQAQENQIQERFNRDHYGYDGHQDEELPRLAEAFRIYCREVYDDDA